MHTCQRRVGWNGSVWVVAEPLRPPVPDVSMKVISWARGHQKEWNAPEDRQRKADKDNVTRELRRLRELADGEEIRDAGNGQRDEEQGRAITTAVAGPDDQRRKHDDTQNAEPAGWREPHKSAMRGRRCATTCSHSFNQAAVCGAMAGARCNSAASRIKSAATSMS